MPKTNRRYWQDKLSYNVERDKRNRRRLQERGWKVLVIWECQTRSVATIDRAIRAFLAEPGGDFDVG